MTFFTFDIFAVTIDIECKHAAAAAAAQMQQREINSKCMALAVSGHDSDNE